MKSLVFLLALLSVPALAQAPDSVYTSVAEMPAPVGGMEALVARVAYPEDAAAERAEGRVIVQVTVDETGAVSDAACLRSPDDRLCAAAIEAVEASPFEPGRHRGQPVAVRMVVPVAFRLPAPPVASLSPGATLNAPDEPIVETPPVLIGGVRGLQRRLEYPEEARRAGLQGEVFVQFVVDEEGNVTDAECVRSPHWRLCDAAIRAVEGSRFVPGMQGGQPVAIQITLPARFKLN